jgi:hypothetical protein
MMIACKLEKKGNGVILVSTLTPAAGEDDFKHKPPPFHNKIPYPKQIPHGRVRE